MESSLEGIWMGIMNGHDRIRTTSALYCIYAHRGFDACGLLINGQSTVTLSTVTLSTICAPLYNTSLAL